MSKPTTDLLDELRPRVFAIAYRMLGSVSEAEDVVQETLLRVHAAIDGGEEISSPRAYAATVATRLAIDELRSARVRRETYVGEWLPEPITERPEDDPARQAEVADSLSLAFLVLLESLSPEQRAAFLLHDVFDYEYGRVAEIVGTSEQNARKLASRARHHVQEGRARFDASAEQREELASSFFSAVQEGDFEALEALLSEDVELHGDGGGVAPAIRHPVHGRKRTAQLMRNWGRLAERMGGFQLRRVSVNGQPGAEFLNPDGQLISVLALDIADGQVQTIRSIVNPAKLGHLGPLADTDELLELLRGPR
jgi:RNA polymerase sigma-70 factor (TIGR02957 family)